MLFRIPDTGQSLLQVGTAPNGSFQSGEFRVLVWNIWKGKRGAHWQADLKKLASGRELVLLQEAMTSEHVQGPLQKDLQGHEWHMAASFAWFFSHFTGVMTGSLASPKARNFLRSEQREFFFLTPKITLATTYELPKGKNLLVLNTHVVNFTTTSAFRRFLAELMGLIESHDGPLLLAGDFNTWSEPRRLSLLETLRQAHLLPVDFHEDPRHLKLDYVFLRDLSLRSARVRTDIKSSDHYPLEIELHLPANA